MLPDGEQLQVLLRTQFNFFLLLHFIAIVFIFLITVLVQIQIFIDHLGTSIFCWQG